ncbi:MAG: acyl-CoA dehydrogenase [Rhodospirillaceae bacterium]|jgi:citronellyl-CoA dehydrogenase|nr:acyl-CoA dehydrogenase [Rhodospirillaceae bacterium]MBT5081571.1 acyl-CoA dehydrogenase [Rhodospirillaceae bacterium]MBT5527013.1 acyl-CoA dehydrogenase [Rhodospirillaceae bacterium]MBT5881909.1 acyl-CoA dehydrogenase [Rhodospirillaceae bacterium]MBT6911063.1 acyl-CoA dehydrogenase [Rhodospirillaceae bacterium]
MLFTEQHEELRNSVRRFVEAEINPYVDDWEEEGRFPAHELFKKMGSQGFLGVDKAEDVGGMGLDYSYVMAFAEEMGTAHHGSVPMAVGVQTAMATPALAQFGSDELRQEFLAPAVSGDMVAAIGVTEPGAGSDVASLKTNARKDGDDYIINGSKMFITNGAQADWVCLLCNTSDGPIHRNKTLICVPMNTPGVTVERTLNKMGMRASDTALIFFDDVRVPQRNRIANEGEGFTYQMIQFQEERLWGALSMLRPMEKAIQDTIEYTRDRKIFGGSILDNQVVHFRMAELTTEIELLRSLVYRAGEDLVAGEDVTYLASMAKLKGGRLVREVSDSCLQYWGGMGYMWESKIGRLFRDGRLMSIGGGADEVMLQILCKYMDILPGRRNK